MTIKPYPLTGGTASGTGGENGGGSPISCNVPSVGKKGDLLFWSLAGRDYNFGTPSGFTTIQAASGNNESSVTGAPCICYRVLPEPIPASYASAGSPSFNYMTAMGIVERTVASVGGVTSGTGSGSTITPGSVTLAGPATVLVVVATNTGNNFNAPNYTPHASYTPLSNVSAGSRVSTAIFAIQSDATFTPPTISISNSGGYAWCAFPLYGKSEYEVVSY